MKRLLCILALDVCLLTLQAADKPVPVTVEIGDIQDDSSQRGIEHVRVQIEGLACPFCVYNIKKRVTTLDGVDRKGPFNVSVEKGVATFAWKRSVSFNPASVNEQIKRAGFTPGAINVTVSGQLLSQQRVSDDKQMTLRLTKAQENIAVSSSEQSDRALSFSQLLRKAEGLDRDSVFGVRILAHVHQEKQSWRLVLQRWEPIVYGAKVTLTVEGFACERCAIKVMRAVSALKNVIHVEVDHEAQSTIIWTRETQPDTDTFKVIVVKEGFTVIQINVLSHNNQVIER